MKCRECDCRHEVIFSRWSSDEQTWVKETVHQCWGVKDPFVISNIDQECTEYEYKRNNCKKEVAVQDAVSHYKYGISHDIFSEPVTTYAKMSVEALEKQIPKKVVSYSDDESDHVYCPCCHECIGSNDIIYDEFYCRGFAPMYCQECGQAMIWK